MFVTIMISITKLIVLAIGFGVGFLLITAAGRESAWKRILGAVFGWILVLYAVAITAMLCFLWIDYLSKGSITDGRGGIMQGCPMMRQRMMQRPGMQRMQPQFNPLIDEENEEED